MLIIVRKQSIDSPSEGKKKKKRTVRTHDRGTTQVIYIVHKEVRNPVKKGGRQEVWAFPVFAPSAPFARRRKKHSQAGQQTTLLGLTFT